MSRIFTPRPVVGTDPGPFPVHEDGSRRVMHISDDDSAAFEQVRHTGAWVAVTDLDTGLSVLARHADCGASCFCAAEYLTANGTMILAESLTGKVVWG